MRTPIRGVLAILPVLLLWLGICGYLLKQRSTELEAASRGSQNLAQAFEQNILRTIETIDTTIRAIRVARGYDPQHFDLAAWEHDSGLTRTLTFHLSMADRNGTVSAGGLDTMTGKHLSAADQDDFLIPRDTPGDTLFIGRPLLGQVSGRWSVQFARKLFDREGTFDGVVVASLDAASLSGFYTSLDISRGSLLLLGRDGFVRSAAPEGLITFDADLSHTLLLNDALSATQGTVRMTAPGTRTERIYSWRNVDRYGLIVAVGLSTKDALASYRSEFAACVITGVLLTLLMLVTGIAFARIQCNAIRSRDILQAAVDNISQGLIVIDPDRRVPLLNARAAELLGLPPELANPGYAFDTLLSWQLGAGELDGPDLQRLRTLVNAGGVEAGDSVYRRTRRNGTVLEIRTKTLPTGLAVRTFTDVTDQEMATRGLADARDAAEAAMRIRSEFLAVMSHEIRTPLNGVIGVAGLLEDMELGSTQRDHVRLIRQSGDHLLGLVNDILDFSRLESDRLQLEETDFDTIELIEGVVAMFMTQATTKGLHLAAIPPGAVLGTVTGDPGRLRQILINLIGNAVKFTDHGWISLTLRHETAGDSRIKLLFSVADSGIGIIPEAIERMFQEFTQMDGSISRRFGGSGLGLAICRRLVELMGGTISVESQPTEGSTFRFDVTLKLAGPAAIFAIPLTAAPFAEPPLRILLAEDTPTSRLVALRLLERLGHQADAVGTGIEAITALSLIHYDLILMDVMMPEMDGVTATRQIRAAECSGTRIPIIGLTARSSEENLAACLAAGMDAVTTKPVTLSRLRAAIAEGRKAVGQVAVAIALDARTPRLRDLIDTLGEDAVAEIVAAFSEDTQGHLTMMREAVGRDDRRTIYRCAHSVAGAARNVGAENLASRASALEQTVGSLTAVRLAADLAAMQVELDRVLTGLNSHVC